MKSDFKLALLWKILIIFKLWDERIFPNQEPLGNRNPWSFYYHHTHQNKILCSTNIFEHLHWAPGTLTNDNEDKEWVKPIS